MPAAIACVSQQLCPPAVGTHYGLFHVHTVLVLHDGVRPILAPCMEAVASRGWVLVAPDLVPRLISPTLLQYLNRSICKQPSLRAVATTSSTLEYQIYPILNERQQLRQYYSHTCCRLHHRAT
jgi:hypothetical protein